MKISKVEVVPFGIPIQSFVDAYSTFDRSNAVLVKVSTDSGIVGIGEACAWEPEFYGETVESVATAIQKYVAPRIVGQDPTNIGQVMAIVDTILAKATCVKEGIDIALFDLVGKTLNTPVYALLNGQYRDTIPVASEIGIDTPPAMAKQAQAVVKMGIRVIKIKGSADSEKDVERVQEVRRSVGPDVALRIDPNAHWTTHGAIKAMRQLESCNLQYLEQPVPGNDLNGMARIRASIGIPLMADESVWTPSDVLELARHGAADIVNIKISKTGGLLQAKKLEAVAEAEGMPCVIGTEIEPGFSLAAKIHIASSLKHLPFACEFTELSLLRGTILKPQVTLKDGCLEVPKGPGLGFELDEQALSKYRINISL